MEKIKQVSIRLVKERPLLSEEQLISPEKVAMVVGDYIRDLDREALCVINFNSKLQPINFNLVSIGAVDTTIATPREILKSAILWFCIIILPIYWSLQRKILGQHQSLLRFAIL